MESPVKQAHQSPGGPATVESPWHGMEAEEALRELDVDGRIGLERQEVQRRPVPKHLLYR